MQATEVKSIPLAEIREPALPVRAAMNDDALESLARSIRDVGIINPLTLIAREGYYEIAAGHRRFRAARQVGLAAVPAIVLPADSAEAEAVKIHENIEREELNPAEEAIFYAQLLEKFQYTEEAMCKVVKQGPGYIADRLRLVRGDQVVLKALLEGKITLGVAQELNRMKLEKDREYYLQYAAQNGAGVNLVREWRIKANLQAESPLAPSTSGAPTSTAPPGGSPAPGPEPQFLGMAHGYELGSSLEDRECRFCGTHDQDWKMFKVRVCQPCAKRIFVQKGRE